MEKIWMTTIGICAAGYLLGSVLFAQFFALRLRKVDLMESSRDGNPGTANAFMQAGFVCGMLALLCDLAKGIIPVYLFLHLVGQPGYLLIPVMLAPVLGHAYSLYHHLDGGKCIAVSFGVLLGLFPDLRPALTLAFFYILFSIVRIRPHSRRTWFAFMAACITDLFLIKQKAVVAAMWLMSFVVLHKHAVSERRLQMSPVPQTPNPD